MDLHPSPVKSSRQLSHPLPRIFNFRLGDYHTVDGKNICKTKRHVNNQLIILDKYLESVAYLDTGCKVLIT